MGIVAMLSTLLGGCAAPGPRATVKPETSGTGSAVTVATRPSTRCDDEVDTIVMQNVLREIDPRYNYLSVWLSHDYREETWRPKLDAEQQDIDRIKQWSESLDDKCVRNAYAGWLDFAQRDLDSAWRELRTQETKLSQDAYNEERRIEQEKARDYSQPVPTPPRKIR
jgi:hypothetical protein